MPRVAIAMTQTAGGPTGALTAAVQKSGVGGIVVCRASNSGGTPTTTFNVMDYGAHRDGVTDDGPHIKAAYDAAFANSVGGAHSTVLFPPGTYYITKASSWNLGRIRSNDWVGQGSPTVHRAGVIRFSGYGATIKYANETGRFSFLMAGATYQYETHGNLEIEGFTFDNNWRYTAGECAQIIWIQGTANVDNITIRDCTTTPNMTSRVASWTNTMGVIRGIFLCCGQVSRDQLYYGYTTNITIENCTIYAQGKGISVHAANPGTDTTLGTSKYLYDNINIADCWVDIRHTVGTCIHLGSYGAGYRCSVKRCFVRDSGDNLIEVDAFNEVLVEDCVAEKAPSAIGFTWFSYPYKTDTPNYTIRNCTYGNGQNPYGTDIYNRSCQAFCQVTLGAAATQLRGREWGNFTIDGCDSIDNTPEAYSAAQYPYAPNPGPNMWQPTIFLDAPLTSVYINNCDITDTGGRASSATVDLLVVKQKTPGDPACPCYIHDVRYRTATDGAYSTLPVDKVTVTGFTAIDSDIAGL